MAVQEWLKVGSRDARILGRKALEVCEQDILAGSRWLWLWEPDVQARAIFAELLNADLLTERLCGSVRNPS